MHNTQHVIKVQFYKFTKRANDGYDVSIKTFIA